MEDLDWYRNKYEFEEKKAGVLDERKIWTDMRIRMNLKKKKRVLDERKITKKNKTKQNKKKKTFSWLKWIANAIHNEPIQLKGEWERLKPLLLGLIPKVKP